MNSKKKSWEGDYQWTRLHQCMNDVPFVDGNMSSLELDFGTPISYIHTLSDYGPKS